jgi:hypothetical protein
MSVKKVGKKFQVISDEGSGKIIGEHLEEDKAKKHDSDFKKMRQKK